MTFRRRVKFTGFTMVVLFGIAIVLATLGGVGSWGCQMKWGSDFETKWDAFSGCKVKVGDKFWPEDRIRATDLN